MEKLASVTPLRPRAPRTETPLPADDASTTAYWERLQALRTELAELKGAG